jgi:hypothetical protein
MESAWAHAYPAFSTPQDGATVSSPPREIIIRFTEGVEIEFSRIEVKNAKGEVVNLGKVRQLAPETLATELKPLSPGVYTIDWQVLSVDTHVTEGRLRFSVGSGGQ